MLHYTQIDPSRNFAWLSAERQELCWFLFFAELLGATVDLAFFRNLSPVLPGGSVCRRLEAAALGKTYIIEASISSSESHHHRHLAQLAKARWSAPYFASTLLAFETSVLKWPSATTCGSCPFKQSTSFQTLFATSCWYLLR